MLYQEAIMTSNRTANVWLDVENLVFGLFPVNRTTRFPFNITVIDDALRQVGDVAAIYAYGDFRLLSRVYHCDVQAAFQSLGVITHQNYGYCKNSADMWIASAIHVALREQPEMTTVVIGSGDGDFRPVATDARKLGKELILIAPNGTLSRQLKVMADQVIHIGGNSPVVVKYMNGYQCRQSASDIAAKRSSMPMRG
jgi:NYN domain